MAKADDMQKLFDASQEVAREVIQLQGLSFGLGGPPRHRPPKPKPRPGRS